MDPGRETLHDHRCGVNGAARRDLSEVKSGALLCRSEVSSLLFSTKPLSMLKDHAGLLKMLKRKYPC